MIWLGAMVARIGRFFREITTARDNQSADIVRVIGLGIAVQFIWLAGANWVKFDPEGYAKGAGIMLVALGSAMRFARPTEPAAAPASGAATDTGETP